MAAFHRDPCLPSIPCVADESVLSCRYEVAKKKGDYDEEQMKRENAKQALERYMHYYQRWAENDKARLQVGLYPVKATGITGVVCSMHSVVKQSYSC